MKSAARLVWFTILGGGTLFAFGQHQKETHRLCISEHRRNWPVPHCDGSIPAMSPWNGQTRSDNNSWNY